ncbi:unnamed protein product [Citrullus colocynthis]|uniref:Uncharacterized protein n=1 Tax=Citrullus colocynthis TaxID=252529 RepID=A0ABP0Z5Z7_9ROSI
MAKLIVLFMVATSSMVGAYEVLLGAYCGLAGNDLPPPWKVVPTVSKIQHSSGSLITNMATNHTIVEEWFITYIAPFIRDFTINYIIIVGHGIPSKSPQCSLPRTSESHHIVKTPPSSGAFDPTISKNMRGILQFLWEQGSPLMVGLHPYKTYVYSSNISLGYATFTEENSSLGKLGAQLVGITILQHHHLQLHTTKILRVILISSSKRTPMKPNIYIQGFIQSIFNENEEPEGESRCYGMFNVDSTPIYPPVF